MDLDDLEPKTQPVKLKDLTHWNIEDLELYIAKMEKEIHSDGMDDNPGRVCHYCNGVGCPECNMTGML